MQPLSITKFYETYISVINKGNYNFWSLQLGHLCTIPAIYKWWFITIRTTVNQIKRFYLDHQLTVSIETFDEHDFKAEIYKQRS